MTGSWATGNNDAIVSRDGDLIFINIPIYFDGPAASDSNIDEAISSIENKWTGNFGEFNVFLSIIEVGNSASGHHISLYDGVAPDLPQGGNGGHSFSTLTENGYNVGHWSMADIRGEIVNGGLSTKGSATFAHEIGHFLDQSATADNPNAANIMGENTNTNVTAHNIEVALSNFGWTDLSSLPSYDPSFSYYVSQNNGIYNTWDAYADIDPWSFDTGSYHSGDFNHLGWDPYVDFWDGGAFDWNTQGWS